MSRLPTVTPRQMAAALKRVGFLEHHQTSSHLYLYHPETRRMTAVAIHARDLKRGTMKRILKQANLTEDEFRELL